MRALKPAQADGSGETPESRDHHGGSHIVTFTLRGRRREDTTWLRVLASTIRPSGRDHDKAAL
jgi:hypothetical protein